MPIARNNAKSAAMEDASGNNIRQRRSMPLTLNKKDVKEDKAPVAAPEQPTEADRDTTDYTEANKGKVTSAQSLPQTEEHGIKRADGNLDTELSHFQP